ncbi:MAG: DUF177 domain-containing protein [Nitrospirae bacterium]|nr:MAG: DUF177 domain-containing protein [Nitrospirota bacterium]
MKILIEDIPEEGLSVDVTEKIQTDTFSAVSPVVSHLELHKQGSEVMVDGDLDADIELQCSRCLKDFRLRMKLPVNVVYHPLEEIAESGGHAAKHALHHDEMDMGFYSGGELDLNQLLTEQLILNTQMKPLCDEQCKGICPVCGTDLNTGSCNCTQKEIDPRLEVLKKLLSDRKE